MLTDIKRFLTQPAFVASILVVICLLGVQKIGILEPIELKFFDQMVRMRREEKSDPRLLVVGVTEEDLQKLKKWPLSGEILDNVFTKLEQYQAKTIGLDIFRDLRVDPGHDQLLQHLQKSDRIVSVCKHSDTINPAIPAPVGVEPYQVGFSDVVTDADSVIRRNLIYLNPEASSLCKTPYSLSLQLALRYLDDIQPQITSQGDLQIGNTVFKKLQATSGAYQNADVRGYQILLNYRSGRQIAQEVSLSDVLDGKIDPTLVKDRVVLIGSTAPSIKDLVYTPYSSGTKDNRELPGVYIHAHSVSQILNAVKDQQSLFWFLPELGEIIWIFGWTITGGFVASRVLHPLHLGLATSATIGTLLVSNFVIFTQAGWLPVVSPALGLVMATGSVVAYNGYQTKQQQAKIAQRVKEQEDAIAVLQSMLKQARNTTAANTTGETTATVQYQANAILDSRYQIIQPLGAGGFGKTYLAADTNRPGHPQCVLKHLQPARHDEQFLAVARRLFKTEAEILELLGKHPQIPQLLAFFETNEQFYLVQELIKGQPLDKEMTPGKRFSEAQVIDLLKDVLKILTFIHSHRVIHRDIKPSNLIRREQDRRLVLIDFGAVKQIQSHKEEENQTIAIGSAGYAPPEQVMGQPKLNSDIYALGMLGIQALTGIAPRKIPRDNNTGRLSWHQHVEVKRELAAILDKMVAYDFSVRYQSVEDVLHDLQKL